MLRTLRRAAVLACALTISACGVIAPPDDSTPVVLATPVTPRTATALPPTSTPLPDATMLPGATTPPSATSTSPPPEPTATLADVTSLPSGDTLQLVRIATGFDRPLYLTSAGDGSQRMFVVEQRGLIWTLHDSVVQPDPFLDIRDRVDRNANERGLLGLAFAPDFATSGVVYVHYSTTTRNGLAAGDTVLASYLVDPGDPTRADPASETILLTQRQPFGNHNGGQLAFGPDGYLYMGLGDGGSGGDPQNHGQNPSTLLGTILRLDVSASGYTVPPDNPFVNGGGAAEVWAWGLRNPWRFSFDSRTGDLYIGDVGQNRNEEISFQAAGTPGGVNYGWRPVEGFDCFINGCDPSLYAPPVVTYDRSGGCSVTGGYVYRGTTLPALYGVYLYADYCTGNVWGLVRDASGAWQHTLLLDTDLTIASFGVDDAGELYLLDHAGSVFQLLPR